METKMKKMSFLAAMMLFVYGCETSSVVQSQPLTEPVEVVALIYNPGSHHSSTSVGMTTNGDISFSPVSVTIPAYHGVLFECQHGRFVVSSENLWKTLRPQQKLEASYAEVYLDTKNGDKLVSRQFVEYKFISVTPVGEEKAEPIYK